MKKAKAAAPVKQAKPASTVKQPPAPAKQAKPAAPVKVIVLDTPVQEEKPVTIAVTETEISSVVAEAE